MTIISLSDRRTPVIYSVHVTHFYDGTAEFFVEGIADDDRSRASAAAALRECADHLDTPPNPQSKGE